MKTSRYKTGVLEIISRARAYNSEIGQYVSHLALDNSDFLIRLTNGTLKMPQDAAHSQQVFPAHVPEAWIREIETSFVKTDTIISSDIPRASLITKILKFARLR